jgi:ATP-dependent DNA helicase RecQ
MRWLNLFEQVLFDDPIVQIPSRPLCTWTVDYAIWRLWWAKNNNPTAVIDHAVLVRQCLRWMSPQRIRCDHLNEDQKNRFAKFGIHQSLSGYLEVGPYFPDWLGEGSSKWYLDELPQVASIDESFPAEGWLEKTTGKSTWRSHAQKEACCKTLASNSGETNLIGLPTGSGKSLVFQVAATFSKGLTVIIVPTVALGLDQLAIAESLPSAETLKPMNYSSDGCAETVKNAVANRQCRLLFISPEACVSGRLRFVLDQHASEGWLQWIVVDEAHIVESWGADFRIEFQLLGALVRDWRRRSDNQLRTLLLSATFADSTQEILRHLFVEEGQHWEANVVQRLRPEIHYHIQRATNEDEQTNWIEEALLRLPRPMILYVTEKADANRWYNRAKNLGFERVETFHGDVTQRGERNRIMKAWRTDRIDLMVATSAFGMGVDKPDVRAVIHACFPESIDRFYQEVGRGGRDGATMQSVLIYTEHDKRTGKGLVTRLLKPKTINARWSALWKSRKNNHEESGTYQVNCSARRVEFIGSRTYQENIRWNKRLLQMLHRAGLLTITRLHSERIEEGSEEYIEWVTIKELRFPTLDPDIGRRLSNDRITELSNFNRGFEALESCDQEQPVCRELQKYYGENVVLACGSCRACRMRGERRRTCGPLHWPKDNLQSNPRVNVVPMTRFNNRDGRDEWVMAIRDAIEKVTKRFVVTESDYDLATSLFQEAMSPARLRYYRLDFLDGNHLPLVEAHDKVVAMHLSGFQPELDIFNLYGKTCSHWIQRDQVMDSHGRPHYTQDHASRLFDSFESWIFES